MSISEADVRHVAILARLALSDEQVSRLKEEMNSILGHMDQMQSLDLEGVEPTSHSIPLRNATRPDVVKPGLSRDLALMNAPQAENGAFVIPRIVGVEEGA